MKIWKVHPIIKSYRQQTTLWNLLFFHQQQTVNYQLKKRNMVLSQHYLSPLQLKKPRAWKVKLNTEQPNLLKIRKQPQPTMTRWVSLFSEQCSDHQISKSPFSLRGSVWKIFSSRWCNRTMITSFRGHALWFLLKKDVLKQSGLIFIIIWSWNIHAGTLLLWGP